MEKEDMTHDDLFDELDSLRADIAIYEEEAIADEQRINELEEEVEELHDMLDGIKVNADKAIDYIDSILSEL